MTTGRRTPLAFLLSLLLALALVPGLAACGGGGSDDGGRDAEEDAGQEGEGREEDERDDERDAEREVERQVDEALGMLTGLDEDEVRMVLGDQTCDELEAMGVEPVEFYEALFASFDYSIDDVTVDGDEATVDLTVTNVDFDAALLDFEDELVAWAETDEALEAYAAGGEDALMAAGMQLFMDMLANGDVTTFTQEASIDMELDSDGEWQFADEDQLAEALLGSGGSEDIGTGLGEVFEA